VTTARAPVQRSRRWNCLAAKAQQTAAVAASTRASHDGSAPPASTGAGLNQSEARKAYARALELAHDAAERRLLERRIADLDPAWSVLSSAAS
jgi:predicted RNA polymerase sigma factor